jgi:hypothetical protein
MKPAKAWHKYATQSGAVGTIVARYQVADIFTDPNEPMPRFLGFGYIDGDATGFESRVVVKLFRIGVTDGQVSLVMSFASETYNWPWYVHDFKCRNELIIDFSKFTYFIEARITRTVATARVALREVRWYNQDSGYLGCPFAAVSNASPHPAQAGNFAAEGHATSSGGQ